MRRRGKVLTPVAHGSGYFVVTLHRGSEQKVELVHRLVLLTFCGVPPEGAQARHLDGNRSNNALSNLQWGTVQENAYDRERHNTVWRKFSTIDVERARDIKRAGNSHRTIANWLGMSKSVVGYHLGG
jgi:hypothetical protein